MEVKRKIAPPAYLFLSLLLMWLLNRYLPVYEFIAPPAAYAGIIPILLGIAMAAVSASKFLRVKTGLEPFEEATVLVTSGFYRFSRNPMYLGMFLLLLGVAFLMGSLGAVLPIPVFMMIIRNNFVMGEERFMQAAFGQQYLDYKSTVRRWL